MKSRTLIRGVVALGLLAVLLGATYVWASPTLPRLAGVSVPSLMNYQGVLSDPTTGDPVPDGDYDIRFALYGVASGGTALWTETQTVTVETGLFNVLLGSVNPLSPDDFTGATYLGVKVGADAEMTPRQQVVSVPYAIHAQQASGLASGTTVSGTSASAILTVVNSGAGAGVRGAGDKGPGAILTSAEGHALVADGPTLAGGPTSQQLALLRWYEVNEAGNTYLVTNTPRGICFDGAHVWVAKWGSDKVAKILASDGTIVGTYDVGRSPWDVAYDGGCVWVVNEHSNDVTKLRASDGLLMGVFAVGTNPRAIAFDGKYMWVANAGANTVTKLEASSGNLAGTYDVGQSPVHIAFDGEHIWVANADDDTVMKLQRSDGSVVGTYDVGDGPQGLAFDGACVWAANAGSDNVTRLRASDGTMVGTYNVGDAPHRIAFDGFNIWVTNYGADTVTKLQASNGAVVGTYSTSGDRPLGICFDGANIWVTHRNSDTVVKM